MAVVQCKSKFSHTIVRTFSAKLEWQELHRIDFPDPVSPSEFHAKHLSVALSDNFNQEWSDGQILERPLLSKS